MTRLLIVGVGGFVGAVARYGISGWVHRISGTAFPYGTLTVNAVGCLLIGVLMHLVEDRGMVSPNARMLVGVGFLGALTTFSTFGYETLALVQERAFRFAVLNVAANMVIGLTAVWIGRTLPRALGV